MIALAYHSLYGRSYLEDLELPPQDDGFSDALGDERIPDLTTAGDFCRRGQDTTSIYCEQCLMTPVATPGRGAVFKQAAIEMDDKVTWLTW